MNSKFVYLIVSFISLSTGLVLSDTNDKNVDNTVDDTSEQSDPGVKHDFISSTPFHGKKLSRQFRTRFFPHASSAYKAIKGVKLSRKITGKEDTFPFSNRFSSKPNMTHNLTKINTMHGQSNAGDNLTMIATQSAKAIKPKKTSKIDPKPHERPNSKRKLTGNGKKHKQQIIAEVRNRSKTTHPTAKGKITMVKKELKITGDGKENNIRSKLITDILVKTKPKVFKKTQEIKGYVHKSQDKERKQHDGKRYKSISKHVWMKTPIFSEEQSRSGYSGVAFILVIAFTLVLYGLYHNRQKLIVLVLEYRNHDTRPSSKQYRRLEDAMPSFKQAIS